MNIEQGILPIFKILSVVARITVRKFTTKLKIMNKSYDRLYRMQCVQFSKCK
jgi:hypothetical protein